MEDSLSGKFQEGRKLSTHSAATLPAPSTAHTPGVLSGWIPHQGSSVTGFHLKKGPQWLDSTPGVLSGWIPHQGSSVTGFHTRGPQWLDSTPPGVLSDWIPLHQGSSVTGFHPTRGPQ
ncbi:hypothetical protein ACOMHN_063429 [Nucella lapillus]